MKVVYDKYYQTENLFGDSYPELIDFCTKYPFKGKVLDLGCGQGRDSIPLARLGYTVTGIDESKIGIEQMNRIAKKENLKLNGKVADIFEYDNFDEYDLVLLDSMFHFAKKDRKKEIKLIQTIISEIKNGCLIIFCIQETGKKVELLNNIIDPDSGLDRVDDKKFEYLFEDPETGHMSKSEYRMIIVKK